MTIKAGVKLSEQSPCGAAGVVRRNIGHNSLKRIVTSGDSVLEGFFVSKTMLPCLQNILYEREKDAMKTCYMCGCNLTSDNETKEHVFIQAIGGRLSSKTLLCQQCNSNFGSTIDNVLADELNFISNMLNIKRDRGKPPAFNVEDTKTGEVLSCEPGGKLQYIKPTIEQEENQYHIRVNDLKQAKEVIRGLKRHHPEIDEKTILESMKTRMEYLDHPVSFEIKFGEEDSFRSICKTAINFYLYSNGCIQTIEHLLPYIKREVDRDDIVFWANLKSDPIERAVCDICHNIIVIGDHDKGILFSYIEFFGVYRTIVVLNNQYKGNDFKASYFFDVILRQEIKRAWKLELSKNELEEMAKLSLPVEAMIHQIYTLMEKIQKKQSNDHVHDLLEKALDNSLRKYPEGTLITEEMCEELTNETMTQVVPWLLHIFNNQKKNNE